MTSKYKILKIHPSKHDHRDRIYKASGKNLRDKVDLREWDSLIENQDQLGSCVGHAVTSGYELITKKKYPEKFVELSRLFVYYNARFLEDTQTKDVGVSLKDALKSVNHIGVCEEKYWPYKLDMFDDKPSIPAYRDAITRTITEYHKLNTLDDVLDSINDNKPVVIGACVFTSFMYLDNVHHIVPMPKPHEKNEGGHAMLIVGYDIPNKMFLIKNSFGQEWGMNGYAWMPFEYAEQQVFEFWTFEISNPNDIQLI